MFFKSFIERFEEQASKNCHDNAIYFPQENLSFNYQLLNNKANKIAHYLNNIGIVKGDTVAFTANRTINSYVLVLALLKLRTVIVPLDLNYPKELLTFITKDSKASHLISNNNLLKTISTEINIIDLDDVLKDIDSLCISDNLNMQTFYEELIYIIYTSGSTGKPKGVTMSQGAVSEFLTWDINYYDNLQNEKVLQFAPFNFDIFFQECLTTWSTGGQLVVLPQHYRTQPDKLLKFIVKERINKIIIPYVILVQLAEVSLINNVYPSSLRKIISTGEIFILTNSIKSFKQKLNKCALYNLYGASENQIISIYELKSNDSHKVLPIGKAVSSNKIFVLDDNLEKITNYNQSGHLYVTSSLLSYGYFNKPDLTAERFIANPFQTKEEKKRHKNTRLYKTGDLVMCLPDGNLEYIERNDFQVKIRGYRIELAQIESILSSYEGIKQSVVIAKEHKDLEGIYSGNKYLVGYYVADYKLQEQHIIRHLQTLLPEYMVPNILVHLENLPLTINGKVDRKKLPDPELISVKDYVAPRDELEIKVSQVWQEVLGISKNKISIRDNFFRLGGDSIVSIQLVSKLRQRLGLNINVKDIFNYKTIEKLYDNVLSKGANKNFELKVKSEQGILNGKCQLLPVQEWFFENNFTVFNHWNQSFLIKTPNLNINKLEFAIKTLIDHHDAFRLRYSRSKKIDYKYTQYYDAKSKVEELKLLDIKTLKIKEDDKNFQKKLYQIFTDWQSGFDIERGPIYSVGYIYGYSDKSSRIYFALHHLIVDTVSWRVLTEDLRDLYYGKDLGKKNSSYRQWVNTVQEYARTKISEKDYWLNILSDYSSSYLNKLLVDEYTKNHVELQLNKKYTQLLLRESNKAYNTQINDILLTALGYALSELTGTILNHIVLEGHGREEINDEININRTLGWFTTMYPVRLKIAQDIGSSLKTIKEILRKIPNKGIGYGALVGYKENPLPRISFNYLGQFDNENNKIHLLESKLQNFWKIVDESSGISEHNANGDYYIININGMIINNVLKFSIESKLDKNNTNKLKKTFKEKLEEIILYTSKQQRSYLTTSDIGNIVSQEYLDSLQIKQEVDGIYLANSLQQGFIYHALSYGDIDDAYRTQIIWEYNSPIKIDKLRKAWNYAQKKFASLRLRFSWEEKLIQIIDKKGNLDWVYIDLSKENNFLIQEQKLQNIQSEDKLKTYKLEQGSLFRVYLIKQREDLYRCIFNSHHSIIDGWSNLVLLKFVHQTYIYLLENKEIDNTIDNSYGYAQKYLQDNQDYNKDYWNKYVSMIENYTDLSSLFSNDKRHLKISKYRHIKQQEKETLVIKDKLYNDIKRLSYQEDLTCNSILQYVWHKVLSIYGNNNQTIVGTIVSGRDIPINNVENSVGLYINTLQLIVNHDRKNESIIDVINNIQSDINEINARSNINLVNLQKGEDRLFDSLFVYQNYPNPINSEFQNKLKINFLELIEKIDYPLGVIAYEDANELIFTITYAQELFTIDKIKSMLAIIRNLLEQITSFPKQNTCNLNYLSLEEYNKILYEWNDTSKLYLKNQTINQLFESQVERTPDSIALVYEGKHLTYTALNKESNQLANYLVNHYQITHDTRVALCVNRGIEMLVSILGVLKAGGAYVPIDPNYPNERVSYMLEDSGSVLLLTNDCYASRLNTICDHNSTIEILTVNSKELKRELTKISDRNLSLHISSDALAYVIYTSGTTGKPKGVMQPHSNVMRLFTATNHWYNFNSKDVWSLFHSYVFDFSVWEIWGALIYGGKLLITTYDQTRDLVKFYTLCIREKITVLNQTPSTFYQFIEIALNKNDKVKLLYLRYIIFGGEYLNLSQLSAWVSHYGYSQPQLINMYGITETTVHVTYKPITNNNFGINSYIGRRLPDLKVYVLDNNLNLLPIGAVGELYIGGEGLARGYLNNEKLTKERFISNPYQTEEEKCMGKNSRLYKTGDMVRWSPEGELEYIGRTDFQVKVRGYRIELGEIESVLSSYLGIKQSIVLVRQGETTNHNYLVGYYTSETNIEEPLLYSYLENKLPDYMVPSILVRLELLPLTINGKLDRKALPEPNFIGNCYVAPSNELETAVSKIWREILGLQKQEISTLDSFFRLGGNSLLAIRVVSKINKDLNCNIKISDIFEYSNIQTLTTYIKQMLDYDQKGIDYEL
jgi:amino acid adenylation domain-containing protein/non-ribosomal peptide synthase protein (TIGR01720 family)